jgi:hypothetical protein
MLDNCTYNKIKLLHELSCVAWFVEKHALQDAQAAGDAACIQMLQDLEKDIRNHIERLRQTLCVVTQ